MVEREFGEAVLEDVIEAANLPNGGAYTSVGSYPATEMRSLVHQLSLRSTLSQSELLEKFGQALFKGLHRAYPHFFKESDVFDFLSTIHTHIHVEVKKLYNDAELPNLLVIERTPERLVLLYESPRKMGDLARGLLQASLNFYQSDDIRLHEEQISPEGDQVKFTLTKI